MRLFRIFQTPADPAPVDLEPAPVSPWRDQLGRVATRAIQTLALLALSAVGIYAIVQLRLILVPVLIALILASALSPVMRRLRSWRVPSALATVIVLVSILGLFGLIGWLVSWTVINQWDDLAESAQEGIQQLRDFVEKMSGDMPITIDDAQIQEWQESIITFLTSGDFGAGAIQGVTTVAHVATGLVLTLVILFFFLKDGAQIWEFLLRPFRGSDYERAKRIGRNSVLTFGGYARGTAIIAAVDAIGIGIGLAILKVPLAIPLTVIIFLTAFIPLIGAVVASGLAALVALVANGPLTALIVIIIAIGVNQLEGNFLQPVVMSRSVNLHALAILLALTAGTILGGIIGALLAVPITAVIWRIISVWHGDDTPARPMQAKT